ARAGYGLEVKSRMLTIQPAAYRLKIAGHRSRRGDAGGSACRHLQLRTCCTEICQKRVLHTQLAAQLGGKRVQLRRLAEHVAGKGRGGRDRRGVIGDNLGILRDQKESAETAVAALRA